jgi:large subunit ribosomal protein L32
MPVPKKRHSPSRQGKRRANWKLASPNLRACAECGAPIMPHHACSACGFYKGKKVLAIKEKKAKKEKR